LSIPPVPPVASYTGSLHRLRLRHLFCFSASSLPAQPGFPSASPLSLSQHFFLRFRYPVSLQPNLLLSFLASVFSTVVLLSPSILSPRLIPDFLCPSQLLPFFSLYGLLMARLWRFGFLFCSSVSFLSRASVSPSSLSPITLLPCVGVY
jgi:hypothetical protein